MQNDVESPWVFPYGHDLQMVYSPTAKEWDLNFKAREFMGISPSMGDTIGYNRDIID